MEFISDTKIFFDGCTAEKPMHFCPPVYTALVRLGLITQLEDALAYDINFP